MHLPIPEEVIIILSLELCVDSANIKKKLSLLMRRTRRSRVGGCLWDMFLDGMMFRKC